MQSAPATPLMPTGCLQPHHCRRRSGPRKRRKKTYGPRMHPLRQHRSPHVSHGSNPADTRPHSKSINPFHVSARDNSSVRTRQACGVILTILQTLYKELDKDLVAIDAGGASDANWADCSRITAADGLGPVKGGKKHTAQECTRLDSVVPRMYLMARTLLTLGHNPNL